MTIKIAIAGTGYIAKIHAEAVRSLPDAELVAVVNYRPVSLTQFATQFNIQHTYLDVPTLLNQCAVDALIICTPNYLHASQAVAALGIGVHVLVEKPMAMNALEGQQMLAAAEKSRALLMVAHCWRFDAEVLWLKQQVDRGELGAIVRTKGYGVHTNWGPGGWFVDAKYAGGGALADMGIHAIDTARFLLGDPQPLSVYARLGTHYQNFDVDDTGIIFVNWDNGVTSYIESGWWQPDADGREAATQLYGKVGYGRIFPSYMLKAAPDGQEITRIESGFPPVRDPHCPQSMYHAQMAYFVDCIKNNSTPVPGGMEGLVNMRIVDAAYASAQANQVIAIG